MHIVWYETTNYIEIWQEAQKTCTLYTLNWFSRGCSFFLQVLRSLLAYIGGISRSVDILEQYQNLSGFVHPGEDKTHSHNVH